jgi:hypothetical protein
MLTLIEQINQKLPQAPESVLEQVWMILNAANEDDELYAEFVRVGVSLPLAQRRLCLIDGKPLAMKMKLKLKQCWQPKGCKWLEEIFY